MHPEERRKIIEDVAGISIYESRKEKSLHELEKTDEKLKEISAILRERTAYLKNLDRERQQALKFKDLELTVKRSKFSILTKRGEEKDKEINRHIQQTSGVEQDNLRNSLANLKAELEGLRVRRESYENRRLEIERRI